MPSLSQELTNICASLIYRKWSEAYDNLKAVKGEKDDGSADFALFHEERLKRANNELANWKKHLDEITPLHTIGK